MFAALVGAIVWDLLTWWFGLPSSSSHALIGGLAGAAVAKAGARVLDAAGLAKIGVSIVLSPLLGLVLGFVLMMAGLLDLPPLHARRASTRWFRRGQLVSAALYSLGHGGNDAQKTMGIIAVLLDANGMLGDDVLRAALGRARVPRRDGARHARSAAGASCGRWACASRS